MLEAPLTIYLFHCVMKAKLEKGGIPVDEKSCADKNHGDYKKSDAASTSCQCACHSRANVTTAPTTVPAAVVDLTVSPCKEATEPPSPAAEHSKFCPTIHPSFSRRVAGAAA